MRFVDYFAFNLSTEYSLLWLTGYPIKALVLYLYIFLAFVFVIISVTHIPRARFNLTTRGVVVMWPLTRQAFNEAICYKEILHYMYNIEQVEH